MNFLIWDNFLLKEIFCSHCLILHTNNNGKDLLQLSFVREWTNTWGPKCNLVISLFLFGFQNRAYQVQIFKDMELRVRGLSALLGGGTGRPVRLLELNCLSDKCLTSTTCLVLAPKRWTAKCWLRRTARARRVDRASDSRWKWRWKGCWWISEERRPERMTSETLVWTVEQWLAIVKLWS